MPAMLSEWALDSEAQPLKWGKWYDNGIADALDIRLNASISGTDILGSMTIISFECLTLAPKTEMTIEYKPHIEVTDIKKWVS